MIDISNNILSKLHFIFKEVAKHIKDDNSNKPSKLVNIQITHLNH